MEKHELSSAVIGVGKMGKHHARILSQTEGVRLVAVCDPSEEAARSVAKERNCKSYSDYRKMLSEEKPDLVIIATPTSSHAEIALACIEAGSNVMVEKPIAAEIEDAEKMVARAKEKGKILMVGHVERFNPAVIALKRIVDSGEIGEPLSIISRRVGVYPPRIKDASVVVDLAVHDIDLMNYFFGREPDSIVCNGGRSILEDRADYAEIFMVYGKATGIVQANWITPIKVRALVVTGSRGYAEIDYIFQKLKVVKPASTLPSDYSNFEEFVKAFSKAEETLIDIPKAEPLALEISHFVESVRNKTAPLTDGKAGLSALSLAKKAEKQIN